MRKKGSFLTIFPPFVLRTNTSLAFFLVSFHIIVLNDGSGVTISKFCLVWLVGFFESFSE